MDPSNHSSSIISNYPNLLEVYKNKNDYLVIDRTINRESYYCKKLEDCLLDITDRITDRSDMSHIRLKCYLYRGQELTLSQLKSLYPELLL